jgi:hypothetical protein
MAGLENYRKDLPVVVEKHYDLVRWLIPKLNKFPRDQRFLLADRIQERLLEVLEILATAMYSSDKRSDLMKVNAKLDCLRLLMRLAADLKYVNIKGYDFFCLKINDIGRMVGGWLKSVPPSKG